MGLDVLDRMRSLADRWNNAGDQRSVFAEAYGVMTENVSVAIDGGRFGDGVWVSQLRDRFAGYYFTAVESDECGEPCPAAWNVAFECCSRTDLHPLQHLFLGINAHINRDLPLALVDVLDDWADLGPADRARRHADHMRVNDVIAETIDEVQRDIVAVRAPAMAVLDAALGPLDEWLISRMIRSWRDDTWMAATRILEGADTATVRGEIEDRARRTADLIEF